VALDTGKFKVLRSSQLDYTIIACQERDTGKLTFRLQLENQRVSIPKNTSVGARTPAASKIIGIAHRYAFSGLKDHIRCPECWYVRASPTVLRKLHGYELPIVINGGPQIGVMNEEVPRELNIRWKPAEGRMITPDGNLSDLTKAADYIAVNVHGIIIAMPIFLAQCRSEQVILGCRLETYAPKSEKNPDDGSYEIAISAGDGSEV